jgi:DeoR/GlpR family transcriptional regulator of sugar metabolism
MERSDAILEILQRHSRVSVAELVSRFGVSEVTARKDLARLEDAGHAVRTRGGAVLAKAVAVARDMDERRADRPEAKAAIARAAAALVADGSSVFIDSGTTAAALASRLAGRDLKVVTHSVPALEIFADEDLPAVYFLGGLYNREARSAVGPAARDALARYSVDLAFVGATAVAPDGSCSAQNMLEADVKRQAFAVARRRVLLADAAKIGAAAFAVFARAGDYDLLITDSALSAAAAAALKAAGVEVLIAQDDAGNARD